MEPTSSQVCWAKQTGSVPSVLAWAPVVKAPGTGSSESLVSRGSRLLLTPFLDRASPILLTTQTKIY